MPNSRAEYVSTAGGPSTPANVYGGVGSSPSWSHPLHYIRPYPRAASFSARGAETTKRAAEGSHLAGEKRRAIFTDARTAVMTSLPACCFLTRCLSSIYCLACARLASCWLACGRQNTSSQKKKRGTSNENGAHGESKAELMDMNVRTYKPKGAA